MTDRNELHPAARRLIDARRSGIPAAAPDIADEASAYRIQHDVGRALGWFVDGPPRFWKSGGASRTAPQTHAALPPDGVWSSPAVAGDRRFRLRFIEAEIALRLGRDVDADAASRLDPEAAGRLVDRMCVSIEVVDSRWIDGFAAAPLARLADLQSHGGLVLGEWVPFERRDWALQRCRVRIGAGPAIERRGTHPMGDPTWVLPGWIRHATADGSRLPAGTVVTTGSWVGLLEVRAGDTVDAAFDGIGEARLQL